jgi:N-acetylated-alpha-linked acidic dipeptidase
MRRVLFIALICLIALLPLSAASPDADTLFGFTSATSHTERDWENKFRAIPDPKIMRDSMQRLSARPHHVGSPYDKQNAEWILSQFKSWGLDAQIEQFDVLFPTPKERVLELTEPTRYTARAARPRRSHVEPAERTAAHL